MLTTLIVPIAHTLPLPYVALAIIIVTMIGYVLPASAIVAALRGRIKSSIIYSLISVSYLVYVYIRGVDFPSIYSGKEIAIWILLLGFPTVLCVAGFIFSIRGFWAKNK